MSKKPIDSLKSFDELDPSQFAEPTDKAAELADELSRQRLVSDTTAQDIRVDADDEQVSKFGFMASQLTDVHEDIRRARRIIPELEARGETEAAQHARDYLDQIRDDRKSILEDMSSLVTPIDRAAHKKSTDGSKTDRDQSRETEEQDPYYLVGRSISEIRTVLRSLKGWPGVARRIDRHHADSSGGAITSDDLLTELAHQVQSGQKGVDKHIWAEYYDRYSSDGSLREPKPKTRGRRGGSEKKKGGDERVGRQDGAKHASQSLSGQSISGYNASEGNKRDTNNMSNPEHRSDDEARLSDGSGNELSDELRELVPDSATPRSPLEKNDSVSAGRRYQDKVRDYTNARLRPTEERDAESVAGPMGHEPWTLDSQESTANNGLRPAEPRDMERVGSGGMGNEPWAIDGPDGNNENPSVEGPPDQFINYGPLAPPEGSSGPPEVERPVEIPPHIIETIPTIPSAQAILEAGASLRNPVDAAIQAVARAKEQREKLFGRSAPRVEKLNLERGNLETAYANYMNGWANLLAGYGEIGGQIETTKAGFQSEIDIRQEEITRIQESDLPEEVKALKVREQQIQIDIHRAAIQECDNRLQELRNTRERVMAHVESQMMYEMAETRLDIESAQAEQNAGSLVGRFKNMWRRHPVARIAIGAGLAAAGFFVGGPIGSAAMVAGVGMRGFGGYMGTEGGVNKFREWRAGKTSAREAEAADELNSPYARALGERHVGNAMIDGARGDRLRAQTEFMQRHAQKLYGERMVGRVLSGDAAAAGEVAKLLLDDQLDRTVEDSRWKRGAKLGGAAVGTALAALGILRHLDTDRYVKGDGRWVGKPPGEPEPPTAPPTAPPVPQPPVGPGHPDLFGVDGRYPWTHMTETLGQNGTPRIMEMAQKAPQYGWQIIGEGGGGSGRVLKVVAPDGFEYMGNANINAALDHLNGLIH